MDDGDDDLSFLVGVVSGGASLGVEPGGTLVEQRPDALVRTRPPHGEPSAGALVPSLGSDADIVDDVAETQELLAISTSGPVAPRRRLEQRSDEHAAVARAGKERKRLLRAVEKEPAKRNVAEAKLTLVAKTSPAIGRALQLPGYDGRRRGSGKDDAEIMSRIMIFLALMQGPVKHMQDQVAAIARARAVFKATCCFLAVQRQAARSILEPDVPTSGRRIIVVAHQWDEASQTMRNPDEAKGKDRQMTSTQVRAQAMMQSATLDLSSPAEAADCAWRHHALGVRRRFSSGGKPATSFWKGFCGKALWLSRMKISWRPFLRSQMWWFSASRGTAPHRTPQRSSGCSTGFRALALATFCHIRTFVACTELLSRARG